MDKVWDNISQRLMTAMAQEPKTREWYVLDNNDVNWSAPSKAPGESCANCIHYGVYGVEEPTQVQDDGGDDVFTAYLKAVEIDGFCIYPHELIIGGIAILNVPSTNHCVKYTRREDQFEDDTLTDDLQGVEV